MTPDNELSELQVRIIADASEVFERVAAEIGGDPPPMAEEDTADPVGGQQLRAAAARLIDLFASLFQEGVEAYLELAQTIAQAPVAGASRAQAGCLALRGEPGARAATTVWIHSAAAEPDRSLALVLTDLHAATGERIRGTLACFVPATVHVTAGTSASSILTVAIPPGTLAGTYFGHVLVSGHPAATGLPLQLVVEPARG